MKINPNSLEKRRKRVYEFYLDNMSLDNIIIKRAEQGYGHARTTGSGRVAKKMPKKKIHMVKHKDGVSHR